jgi:hypothetical protein
MTSPPSAAGPEAEPAAVARGVVAVAHVARLIRAPSHAIAGRFRPPGPRDDDAPVSVVDDGGEPWVLTPPWERPRPGPARLRIVTTQPAADAPPAGGAATIVLLAGRVEARAVATVANLPGALCAALERHRSCFDLRSWPALAISRFVVAGIGVALPRATGAVPRALEPVPLADYAACEPDLWQLQQASLLAHLNERHHDALLALARQAGAPAAAIAEARAVDAEGLTLAAIGPDGARYVRLPFPEPLVSPAEVGPALFGA